MLRIRLLYRAIVSHLMVAVPPAVVLGLLVVDINRQTLMTDAQQLNLSVAGRLRDGIEADVEARFDVLHHAERILAAQTIPLVDKTRLLQAIVASTDLLWLALYAPDGRLDSVVRPKAAKVTAPEALDQTLRERARAQGQGVGIRSKMQENLLVPLVVPLKVGDELRGYVVAPLVMSDLGPRVRALQETFLGPGGRLEVVDAQLRAVVSSPWRPPGEQLGDHTAFEGHRGEGGGLETIEAGISTTYLDESGQPWLASLVSSSKYGWVVASCRPTSVAFVSVAQVQSRTFWLAAMAAMAAGIMGLLLARSTAAPVRELARAVRDSARGGFQARVKDGGAPELAVLGQAFNEALKELGRHRQELRHRTQLQVRLSRHLTPAALHQLLSQEIVPDEGGEEELITVLYVDLAKGTQLQATDGDQQVVDFLQQMYGETCAAIEQQGGRIDQYSGDAVIGLFPRSLVAEPTKAAHRAAEELLKRVARLRDQWSGVDLAVAVGMVSQQGQIIISGDSGELSVSGAIVEQAAALQQAAEAEGIEMDAATLAALG